MLKFSLSAPLCVLFLLPNVSYADNCDDLRAQIDAKIKAAGVASYSVVVVDASASAPGKVVGSCARGAKKIMYTSNAVPTQAQVKVPANAASAPTSSAAAPAPTPAPAKKPVAVTSKSGDPILTECKDGTVSAGGSCKK